MEFESDAYSSPCEHKWISVCKFNYLARILESGKQPQGAEFSESH